jgi:O-antigen/teichoic acid export membrane protein
VYALGGFAYKGLAILAVPLLARLLTPAELGLLDAAAITATLLGLAAGLGTEQAVAWMESRVADERRLWASALSMVGTLSLLIVGVAAVAREPLALVLTGDARHGNVVVLAAVYGSVMAFTAAALNAIRLRSTPRWYAVGSFAVVTAEMIAALGVAWLVPEPVQWMVLGWALSAAAVTVGLLWIHLPGLAWPDLRVLRRLAAFGIPLVPAAVAWLAGDVAIRSALARDASLGTLGEYGVAYRIASVLALMVAGFAVAWHPFLFRGSSKHVLPNARSAMPLLVAALGVTAMVISLLAPELVGVVAGSEYASAATAVPFLTGGMVALGMFTLSGGVGAASGSTSVIAGVALGGMALQVGVAQPLVEAMGLVGGGVASLLGYSVAGVALTALAGLVNWSRSALSMASVLAVTAGGLVAANALMSSPVTLRLVVLFGAIGLAVMAIRISRVPGSAAADAASRPG